MPSPPSTVTRRRVLLGVAAVSLLGGVGTVACGTATPVKDVDDLLGQLDRARSDGQLAADAATAAPPKLAAALTAVAAERTAHAKALTDEITRISGEAPTTSATASSVSSTAATTTTTAGPPPRPPSATDVVAALGQSATGASLAATQQSGYRAGLLGSIAAACTAAATVALASVGPAHDVADRRPAHRMRPTPPCSTAVAAEHAAIYGYGVVSAHSAPDVNYLVSDSLVGHRELREEAIARLSARNVAIPVAAAGYRMPVEVDGPAAAGTLAVRMETDSAVAWRAVLEQAMTPDDRELAVTALTQSAVFAAKWRTVLGVAPVTVAFPGGNE